MLGEMNTPTYTQLQVLHRVPVVLQEDHRICTRQVQAQASDRCGQQ